MQNPKNKHDQNQTTKNYDLWGKYNFKIKYKYIQYCKRISMSYEDAHNPFFFFFFKQKNPKTWLKTLKHD